jgi:hypothetical protein
VPESWVPFLELVDRERRARGDGELQWLAADRRRVLRRGRPDKLWLRIGDVGTTG